jgi:hypothetical protein
MMHRSRPVWRTAPHYDRATLCVDHRIRQDLTFADPARGNMKVFPVGVSQTASVPEARALIAALYWVQPPGP